MMVLDHQSSVTHILTDADSGRPPRRASKRNHHTHFRVRHYGSRASHSNDGAHVEQKNWTHVREPVGYHRYHRYDTPAKLALLNEIWELDRVFTNYLLPQQKLVFKQRNGAKVTKRYDTATTPHQRAITREDMRKRPIIRMNAEFKRVRPVAQSRQILALTGRLETLSLAKKPAAVKPVVNHAFNR